MSIFGADLRIGSIVHYVMAPADYAPGATRKGPQYRPAIVVDLPAVKSPQSTVGLVVFLAGAEDGIPVPPGPPPAAFNCPVACSMWRPVVMHSADHIPGMWHFPE